MIYEILVSYKKVYRFFDDVVGDVIYDDRIRFDNVKDEETHAHLLCLSVLSVKVSEVFAPNKNKFRLEIEQNYVKWLTATEIKARLAVIPVEKNLLNMINVAKNSF